MNNIILPENLKFSNLISFFTTKGFNLESLKKSYLIYFPIQKHTDRVIVINDNLLPQVADSVITNRKGLLLGIKVADCVPILIHDPKKKIVAAVHAGWRSTARGILKKTLFKIIEDFNSLLSDILIAMGPCIKGCCYEVGEEVIEALKLETSSDEYLLNINGRRHVDLSVANKIQAISIGINPNNIWIFPECTFCNHKIFASYRYHGKSAERQYGIIGML